MNDNNNNQKKYNNTSFLFPHTEARDELDDISALSTL